MAESTLIKKLAKVMSDVKYIQKRGKNKFHGYMYATEADVNEKVREELAKVNVLMLPSVKATEIRETKTKSGNTEYIARVDMEFVFVDGDSGEERTILMSGEGQDNGDKAIYKAISGTQKYALMKCFMIPTGDDPEEDRDSEEGKDKKQTTTTKPPTTDKATEPQLKKIYYAAKSKKLDKQFMVDILQVRYSKSESKDLTKKEASDLIEHLGEIDTDGS